MSKVIQQPQLFYFLVTGTLYVQIPRPDEHAEAYDVAVPTLNVVVTTDKPFFGMQCMADAHNGLQMRYREESGDASGSIDNIVINSVFPMGLMTREEYQWRKSADKAEGV